VLFEVSSPFLSRSRAFQSTHLRIHARTGGRAEGCCSGCSLPLGGANYTKSAISGHIPKTETHEFIGVFDVCARVQIPSAPPTSLSIIRHSRESSEIRAWARDLPSHADPERDVVGANRPNFANPLCARFPYVRPHGQSRGNFVLADRSNLFGRRCKNNDPEGR